MEGSEMGSRIQKYFESYIKIVILTAALPTIFFFKLETRGRILGREQIYKKMLN